MVGFFVDLDDNAVFKLLVNKLKLGSDIIASLKLYKGLGKNNYLSCFQIMLVIATLVAIIKNDHFAICELHLRLTISFRLKSSLMLVTVIFLLNVLEISVFTIEMYLLLFNEFYTLTCMNCCYCL